MMSDICSNEDDLRTFMHVVFGGCSGLVPLRSFAEYGNNHSKPVSNAWISADDEMAGKALNFAEAANRRQAAFYVIPGTVNKVGQAGSLDVMQMQVLLIDIDDGDTEAKLKDLTAAIGEPTLIVESGGITKEGRAKLHVYWQLVKAVAGEDLQALLSLRHKIALAFGGDTHFKSAHQPIRVAGSVYHKGGKRRLVKIRSYSSMEYELEELIERISYHPTLNGQTASNSIKTLNNEALPFNDLLTTKVYEGGNDETGRFANLQRVIGYWLRRCHEGLITQEQTIEEIHGYNLANVVPSWPIERIKQMTSDLWELHLRKYGEATKVEEEQSKNNKLVPINPANWQGMPPQREWILQDWLPRGYVTALYGDGGVGKSLLAQQLMTCIATGNEFLGIKLKACKVYALMCEDDNNELWRRQANINEHYGLQMSDLNNIRLVSRVGENNLLMTFNNSDAGQLTEFFDNLRQDVLEHKPDLIILDTVADLFGGNENNRPQVRQFIQTACGSLARVTGGAVLLCAHPSEGGIQKGTGSGGSTAWNNTVRSRWYLKRPEGSQFKANHRSLARVKSNYSTTGEEEYLEWSNGAFISLNPLDFSPRKAAYVQAERHDAERDRKTEMIIKIIEAEGLESRFYTATQFAEAFEGAYGLGSKRSIQDRISVAATTSLIQFFEDPASYGLDIKSSIYGYLCTPNTWFKTEVAPDPETRELKHKLTQVEATHYKHKSNGSLIPIKKAD
jgi:RecA-family ATPase